MTRSARVRKWIGTAVVVGVVSGMMIVSPLLEHPVCAQQQGWAPQPQSWAPPPAGGPVYAPPPVDTGRAVMEATQDAQADENGALWFFAGCLLGVIGVVIAAVADPSPPPARLMGKSPEYLTIYTQTYVSQGHSAQLRSALWGLGAELVIAVVLYVIIVVALVKSQPTY